MRPARKECGAHGALAVCEEKGKVVSGADDVLGHGHQCVLHRLQTGLLGQTPHLQLLHLRLTVVDGLLHPFGAGAAEPVPLAVKVKGEPASSDAMDIVCVR